MTAIDELAIRMNGIGCKVLEYGTHYLGHHPHGMDGLLVYHTPGTDRYYEGEQGNRWTLADRQAASLGLILAAYEDRTALYEEWEPPQGKRWGPGVDHPQHGESWIAAVDHFTLARYCPSVRVLYLEPDYYERFRPVASIPVRVHQFIELGDRIAQWVFSEQAQAIRRVSIQRRIRKEQLRKAKEAAQR